MKPFKRTHNEVSEWGMAMARIAIRWNKTMDRIADTMDRIADTTAYYRNVVRDALRDNHGIIIANCNLFGFALAIWCFGDVLGNGNALDYTTLYHNGLVIALATFVSTKLTVFFARDHAVGRFLSGLNIIRVLAVVAFIDGTWLAAHGGSIAFLEFGLILLLCILAVDGVFGAILAVSRYREAIAMEKLTAAKERVYRLLESYPVEIDLPQRFLYEYNGVAVWEDIDRMMQDLLQGSANCGEATDQTYANDDGNTPQS